MDLQNVLPILMTVSTTGRWMVGVGHYCPSTGRFLLALQYLLNVLNIANRAKQHKRLAFF